MSEVFYSLMIKGSDGQTYYASFKDNLEWIQQRMGICILKQRCADVEEKNRKLELRIQGLEQPVRMKKVKELLAFQSEGRTERWLRFRIPGLQYDDLCEMKKECMIHSFRKAKTILYILKEI
jgi:hypothetical protein